LTISAFRKYVREWKRTKDPVVILHSLDKLELLPPDRKRKILAVDPRSFVDAEGFWNVYPIAIDQHHVYMVCPWCGEVHTHGNNNGDYEGHRVAHCFKEGEDHKHSGYVIQKFENLKG
jgi:hypothetical protein